ncbi:MAG: hypothetical protein KGZ90_09055 [Algoriphagus sp.]|nr:hypothetical protein [Algoriphagus sp.]
MQKKTKLAIKHYHAKELEKIGKSSSSFPLYVMVRYKNAKTKFASRLGIRYVNENGGDPSILSHFSQNVTDIIEAEVKHIVLLRDYFENVLGVEFTPSMVVNEHYENASLEKVLDYFDQIFEDKAMRVILSEINQDLIDLLDVAGATRFLSGIQHLDLGLFQRIMEFEEVKQVFEFFKVYKSLNWPEVNRLQFRMVNLNEDQRLSGLKKWLDEKFDAEMRHLYSLKPIDLSQ